MKRLAFLGSLLWLTVTLSSQEGLIDSLQSRLIITHSKHPVALKKTYKPIIVIDQEEIENHGIDDISSLLDRQRGIIVSGFGSNPGKDKSLFIQGAGGEYSLILIDGMPVTDPSGIGGTFNLRNISLSQVKSIEILKGGQSTLYGSDAVAAVVNIITHDSLAHSSGSLSTSFGSYNSRLASGSVDFILGSVGLHADATHTSTDGISEAFDQQNLGFQNDPSSRNSINAFANMKISNELSIRPYLRWGEFSGDYDNGAFSDGQNNYGSDWMNWGFSARLSGSRSEWKLDYSRNSSDRIFDSQSFGISEFRGRFQNFEVFNHTELSEKVSVNVGLNLQAHKTLDANASITNPNVSIVSPFASLIYSPSLRWNTEIGLRLNHHGTFGDNINHSFGSSYWLSNDFKAYGFFSTSFKAPNLFQLYGQFGANENLLPQIGQSVNLGLSYKGLGLFDDVTVEFFDRRIKDLIVFSFSDGYLNQNEQNDMGLEVSGEIHSGKWKFNMGYIYLFGEIIDGSLPLGRMENLLRRPKHQLDLSLNVDYSKDGSLHYSIRYTGQRDDTFFNNRTFLNENVILEAYWYSNISITHNVLQDRLKLHLLVNNLFDTSFQEIAGFSTMGRNVTIGAKLTFH